MTTTVPLSQKAAEACLLQAMRHHGIEASPRTLTTWLDTADKLCLALATYYRDTEPQATRAITALEEAADEFRLMDL